MAVNVDSPTGELAESTMEAADPEPGKADDPDALHPKSEEDVGAAAEPPSGPRWGIAVMLVTVVALAGVAGWLGYRAHQSRQIQLQHSVFVQVARQGALNLTTIDYAEAEADVQRILESATGTFYDDFEQRSRPFVEVVKKAQSKSEGTIVEAGLESAESDHAAVLIAVDVKTSIAGVPDPHPRAWRMRIGVQATGDGAKVSNVEFVP